MVKNIFTQRLRGSTNSTFPQDKINIFLSDQRLLYVVADHLGEAHFISDYSDPDASTSEELLRSVFSMDEVFRKAYQESYLILCSENAILSPRSFIVGTDVSSGLTETFLKSDSSKSLQSDHTPSFSVNYHISNSLKNYSIQMFPNLKMQHLHSILIEIVKQEVANLPGDRVYAHITEDAISLLYTKDGNLQYVNQFETHNADDVLYFTLLVYDQFDLDQGETPLSISRMHPMNDNILSRIKSYLKSVQILSYNESAQADLVHTIEETFIRYFTPLKSAKLIGLSKSI